jgi:antitoxin VapB
MTLSIKNPEADRLARAITQRTGETITQAVLEALRDRLAKVERQADDVDALVEDILAIASHFRSLPLLDTRSDEEILGYDKHDLLR